MMNELLDAQELQVQEDLETAYTLGFEDGLVTVCFCPEQYYPYSSPRWQSYANGYADALFAMFCGAVKMFVEEKR